ncbi:MAG TPA: hypothetical protein VGC90_09075, partial [Candidatus Limnocylindrales bacterium]
MPADGPAGGAANAERPRDDSSAESAGRVEVIALLGIPEVGAGDPLEELLGEAMERTAGVLPLRDAD